VRLPRVHGIIRRRLLVNYRVDPDVAQKLLPGTFRPKLQNGQAIAGICLIRLENIRPKRFPALLGMSSENAAHRFAVTWEDSSGAHEGVYIPRRDSDSMLNHLAGGRLFSGQYQRATFAVTDSGNRVELDMSSVDGDVRVHVSGDVSTVLPSTSLFASVDEASAFFEGGSLGYSATEGGRKLDGILLRTDSWHVEALQVDSVSSSYFANEALFPSGSVSFDCALIMRNIAHEWESAVEMYV
jgi:hypothetical protein